jgi:hypothetical protein
MNCRTTQAISKIILLFLCLSCSFNSLKAQADPMDSTRYFLDPAKPYDSLRFYRGLEQIFKVDFSHKNLQDLNAVANGYKRNDNLDTAFALKHIILQVKHGAGTLP